MTADSDPPLEALAMQSSSGAAASTSNHQEQHLREQVELLQSPTSSASTEPKSHEQRTSYLSPPPTLAANGYDDLAAASLDANRAITSKSEPESFIHPDLRVGSSHAPTANMMPIAPPSGHSPASSAGPSSNAALAPAPPSQPSPEDPSGDGRKAKRELSSSKRAAQNRAAQRAFRQRKETYIKQLEQEVREYREMEKSYKNTQAENYALREYVITLQARLMDTNCEIPQPPPNINLNPSQAVPEPQMIAHDTGTNNVNSGTQLEAVAQAVAGLAAQEQLSDRHQSYANQHLKHDSNAQDTRSADEINRQLQSVEGGPDPSSNV